MTGTAFGRRHPNAPQAFDQFAFLIGEWRFNASARDAGGNQIAFVGEWMAKYILDGHVIADEFRMRALDGSLIMLGMNFRHYDASQQRWKMKWLDVTASRWLDLGPEHLGGVQVEGSTITFRAEFAPGEIHRITFRPVGRDRFTWQADRSLDAGNTWEDAILTIEAVRTAAP